MIRALLLALALAGPAAAETARVYSGEHGGFTRLVIELPKAAEWTVGRNPSGYAFAAKAASQPTYDFSGVWQRIDRTRLQSLLIDPETGALVLGLGCECHVFPFEYQPGAVVLDIKPGPAPEASAFEADFVALAATAPAASATEAAKGYDWLAMPTEPATRRPSADLPLATGTVSLAPLRDELLAALAHGAADGVVDMKLPDRPKAPGEADHPELPWSNVFISEAPGVATARPGAIDAVAKPPSGCAPDQTLDLAAWGQDRPTLDLLAESRSGLYGEFDAPNADAVLQSVRLLIYLGFGAEALQHANLVDAGLATEELALYRSMARVIDGEADPQTPFAAMLDCDGPAALWAALAHDRLPAGRGVNRDAVLRAFLALPPHLRQHLGPGLAEKLLAHDDAEAARVVRDAIERAPHADKATIALLDASADMQAGDVEAAKAHAEDAVALDGDSATGLIALVEAHFRKREPIDPQVAEALLAMEAETEETDDGKAVRRALVLALALSGQTEAAFTAAGGAGEIGADLWQVAADRATDDDFLRRAVLPLGVVRPDVAVETATRVADRLLALGFPEAALAWIGPLGASDPPDRRHLAAGAAYMRGDPQSAVEILVGLTDPEAEGIRAKALTALGDLPAAAMAYSATGDSEAAATVDRWAGNWAGLDPNAADTWAQAASHAASATRADDLGPLALGAAAVEGSAAARSAVEALLMTVPSPSGG
jgi:hypothetical protein